MQSFLRLSVLERQNPRLRFPFPAYRRWLSGCVVREGIPAVPAALPCRACLPASLYLILQLHRTNTNTPAAPSPFEPVVTTLDAKLRPGLVRSGLDLVTLFSAEPGHPCVLALVACLPGTMAGIDKLTWQSLTHSLHKYLLNLQRRLVQSSTYRQSTVEMNDAPPDASYLASLAHHLPVEPVSRPR